MGDTEMDENLDYTRAREIGSLSEYERIVDVDYPTNEDGSPAGPDDMFKLEFSGWVGSVEFAPRTSGETDVCLV